MTYKAVIFDMGGVIMNYSKMPYIATFFELAKKDSSITQAWSDLETGKMTMKDGDTIFANLLDKNPALKEEMMAASTDGTLLSVFDHMTEDENFAKVVPKLRSYGYLTGLLTNNVYRTEERKRSMIMENAVKKFDVVIESCREGIRKPDPKIYSLASSRLHVDPSECIYLDDFFENCKGAEAIGMKSIQVSYEGTLPAVRELESLLKRKLL